MKISVLLITKLVAVIASKITFIWSIVEFALYLFKDSEFNWWSVYGFIISVIVVIICGAMVFFESEKTTETLLNSVRKSKFQQRLDEIEQKRKETNKS